LSEVRTTIERTVVVVTNGNWFAERILELLLNDATIRVTALLVVRGDYHGDTGLKAVFGLLRAMTAPYWLYKVWVAALQVFLQRAADSKGCGLRRYAEARSIPYREVPRLSAPECLGWLAANRAQLLVSVSCPQRIRGDILSLFPLGGVNIHSSLLPRYAGLAPYFWVLSKGEEETGTTVHVITPEFDAGRILAQERLAIARGESAFHLFMRLSDLGAIVLRDGVRVALDGIVGREQEPSRRDYFSHPKFGSYRDLRRAGHALFRISDLKEVIGREGSPSQRRKDRE
jgi:Formyl transferase